MSIKTFLTTALKNIATDADAPVADTLRKLGDEQIYLSGASEALKAVGAQGEHELTEATKALVKQKAALIESHESLLARIGAFDEASGT